jgi:hypothetical protein
VLLWLLKESDPHLRLVSVSAGWQLDRGAHPNIPPDDRVETVCQARIHLVHHGVDAHISAVASLESPKGSLDENFKLFGVYGAIRIIRDRPHLQDQSAAALSYQDGANGAFRPVDTSGWSGERAAPVVDFVRAIASHKRGQRPVAPLSPASDSVDVLRVITGAYDSARAGGKDIPLT